MRGQSYRPERSQFTDPRSGARVVRLTSWPRMSWNMYFEHNNFTPDSKTTLLWRQREPTTDSPADAYRCDVDGRNMVQVTDEPGVYAVSLSPDGRYAYYLAEAAFKRVSMESFELEEILRVPNAHPGSLPQAAQSGDGRHVFCTLAVGDETGLFRLSTDGSQAELLVKEDYVGHVKCDPLTGVVCYLDSSEGRQRWRMIDAEGGEPRALPVQSLHTTSWLGRTGRLQGCLFPPGRAIVSIAEGDSEPRRIAGGPRFWHAGASLDGEWIAADTRRGDEGLMLIHAPTGSFTHLCDSASSNDAAPQSHPHPAVSPDGSVVVYTSNCTGIPQVYAAHVPEGLREALRHSFDWSSDSHEHGAHYVLSPRWERV